MKYIGVFFLALLPTAVLGQGYVRADWNHWADFDGDCQNTRQEILIVRSLTPVILIRSCLVVTGSWLDPYTGSLLSSARSADIDHVIPLKYAHDHGGALWSPLVKKLFANDPENLEVVSLRENRRKGAGGPVAYMPPSGVCEYVKKWKGLLRKYELDAAPEDIAFIETALKGC